VKTGDEASVSDQSDRVVDLNSVAQGPALDFSADPEIVRGVAEGARLAYAHLFNPAFTTEISMIDPLPHQRIAVYDHMLPQPRLRFLLGDEPRAGKTIMAGCTSVRCSPGGSFDKS
jgi:hypothetical protein